MDIIGKLRYVVVVFWGVFLIKILIKYTSTTINIKNSTFHCFPS